MTAPVVTADLLAALRRLDVLLAAAVDAAEPLYGVRPGDDPFRGLHIGPDEVQRLLAREPGTPLLGGGGETGPAASGPLAGLSAFDRDVLVLALAPELDLRYERLYAYLQDHVAKRRPTVDLALHLFCRTPEERMERRARFHADAPLLREGLLRLLPAADEDAAPLLARAFALTGPALTRLTGGGLDPRLAGFCRLLPPAVTPAPAPTAQLDGLAVALAKAALDGRSLRVHLVGRPGIGRERALCLAAARAGRPLLVVDARTADPELVALALATADAHDALCALRLPPLRGEPPEFAPALAAARGVVALIGDQPWPSPGSAGTPLAVHPIDCVPPDAAERRTWWRQELAAAGLTCGPADLDTLAERFRLTPAQIAEAAATLAPVTPGAGPGDVFAAARAQTGRELSGLTTRIEPRYGWADLVLTADAELALREVGRRVVHRQRVLHDWDFAGRLSLGRGVTALFTGPPGTGKTMAAEVLARELRLDLFRVDLAGVVSKWIGETEKNLDRIFTAALDAAAILFFDEADALFGKRGEVQDSHDRYANIEISYLLQRMESYDGVAVLATNRFDDLDEAFLRRLTAVVRFPLPEAAERLRIWTGVWPPAVPLSPGIDWERLAELLPLSGAEIKNVALSAAFLAAEDGGAVTTRHLVAAARREAAKSGKPLPLRDLEADR